MLTRRTATVTTSAPDSRITFRVISNEGYFPVPIQSRERKEMFPMARGSSDKVSEERDKAAVELMGDLQIRDVDVKNVCLHFKTGIPP